MTKMPQNNPYFSTPFGLKSLCSIPLQSIFCGSRGCVAASHSGLANKATQGGLATGFADIKSAGAKFPSREKHSQPQIVYKHTTRQFPKILRFPLGENTPFGSLKSFITTLQPHKRFSLGVHLVNSL